MWKYLAEAPPVFIWSGVQDRKPAARDLKAGIKSMKDRVTQPIEPVLLLSNLNEATAAPGSASCGIKMPSVHSEAGTSLHEGGIVCSPCLMKVRMGVWVD